MQQTIISIVFHSFHGNTAAVASLLQETLLEHGALVHLLHVEDAKTNIHLLHQSDTIIFGCPTYFGNVSAGFKDFIEFTQDFWYRQPWTGKLAAGFTVSSTCSGDKLNTLIALVLFAAQHGMIWISQGVLPRFITNEQTEGQNRLGSYVGLMFQGGHHQLSTSFHSGDLLTAELFARRVLETTIHFKNKNSYDKNSN